MSDGPTLRTLPVKRPRSRRHPVRFLFLTVMLVLLLILLGLKLWEVSMAILVYIYLGWCFKS